VTTATIDINGATLAYDDLGEGPPVVLVHSGVTDRRMWDANAGALAHDHRVIRYDMRGFGDSSIPGGPFSNARDLAELVDRLDLRRVALVGASFGARVALEYATDHPERVTALVLAAVSLPGHEWSDAVDQFSEREEALLENGDVDAAVALNVEAWVDGPHGEHRADPGLASAVGDMQRLAFEKQLAADRSPSPPEWPSAPEDLAERARRLDVPILLLVGDKDFDDFGAIAIDLERALPRVRRVVLPGVAHLLSMEAPERFNRLVVEHLQVLE
jgi:3-oxoadipate enol-lactonase